MVIYTKYDKFINHLNEADEAQVNVQPETEGAGSHISIKSIEDEILKRFKDFKVTSTNSVYENKDGKLLLVIFIINLFMDKNNIIYNKIILYPEDGKTHLKVNKFRYLVDLNSKYSEEIEFESAEDFGEKIYNIFKKNKFSEDIKTLSAFLRSPAFLLNDYFKREKVEDVTITNVTYDPKIVKVPSEALSFYFDIHVNNEHQQVTIQKDDMENIFNYVFKFSNGEIVKKSEINLKNMVHIIGNTLKNYYKK